VRPGHKRNAAATSRYPANREDTYVYFQRITLAVSAAALALSMGAAAQAASHGGMMKVRIGTEGAYPPFNNLESDGSSSVSTSTSPTRFAPK
jgi:hypothetical protein